MESDFGADLLNDDEDDWVQSYAGYYDGEEWTDECSLDACGQKGPTQSIEELLVSDHIINSSSNIPQINPKRHKGRKTLPDSDTSDRPRKRKRSKAKSGVEMFLNEVLSWNLRDLMSDCRATLRLPRMVMPSQTYKNFSEFTSVVLQVIWKSCHSPIITSITQVHSSLSCLLRMNAS